MRRGQVVAADGDRDPAALLGEVDGGLAGRVAAADDHDLGLAADRGPRDRWPRSRRRRPRTVRGRRRRDGGTRAPDATITARHATSLPSASTTTWKPCSSAQPGHLARRVELGAEALGLDGGARREVLARDAVGEARRSSRCASWRRPARRRRPRRARRCRALGRAVDRRRQPGRTGAHHDEVEQVPGGRRGR